MTRFIPVWLLVVALATACTNNPYRPEEAAKNVLYETFREDLKHLDPALAYVSNELDVLSQIYETLVQYHFLKRPYSLVPLTATQVPQAQLYDAQGRLLPPTAPAREVAKAVYTIAITPGIRYQDHPSFARTADGQHRWFLQPGEHFPPISHPNELPQHGSRELTADDYVYQIKRLASPLLACPIFSLLSNYIEGFEEFHQRLGQEVARLRQERRRAAGALYNQEADERTNPIYLDLRQYELPGVRALDAYTLRISLSRKYPQFVYWLAMPFFAPMAWEADRFYSQSAALEQNMTLNRFPVGTGAYSLAVNQSNYRMVLRRNPNFHHETYPTQGTPEDEAQGLLADRGKRLPFVDELVYVLEKEPISEWNKFLQGYYDRAGINPDAFDQVVQFDPSGELELAPTLQERNFRLLSAVSPSTSYYGFNMLDDVIGGYDDKRRRLRQAVSIALNMEEYIQIFLNGRGIPAHSLLPPGLFGYQEGRAGMNPVVYDWDAGIEQPQRKSLAEAKRLLAEAGYANGQDADGKPLILFFDTVAAGPGSKAPLDWLRKQFASLGIQLQIRSTDFNRFQTKVRTGNFQIIRWGWGADYPDPENFFFLLYGPNGRAHHGGENHVNYANPRFDALFREMENMSNSPQRLALIERMTAIIQHDAPWAWGMHPVVYGLYPAWYHNAKPMLFGRNSLKYKRVDAALRQVSRQDWNRPVTLPLWILAGLFVLTMIPATLTIYRRGRPARTRADAP